MSPLSALIPERFVAARRFLLADARPLEAATFRREFEGGGEAEVLAALRSFQNPDGGFGNALEPDFRLPASSALATSVGLQHLSRLGAAAATDVRSVMDYVTRSYDPRRMGWQTVPQEIEEHPRAPWWEPESAENMAGSWANPTVELISYLYEFPSPAGDELRGPLLEKAVSWVRSLDGALEMHDLLCYLRLATKLSQKEQGELYALLDSHLRGAVVVDPGQWGSYGLQPLQVAPSPASRYHKALADAVEANLDHVVASQGADGAWEPSWNWGRFEDVWQKARIEWMGIITLENLRILRDYRRILA